MRKLAFLFLFPKLQWHYVASDHLQNQATERAENADSQLPPHFSSLQHPAPGYAARTSPPSARRPRFTARMQAQPKSQPIVKTSGTAVQTIAAHSQSHDVQLTADPAILAESGPKHPKNMPSSGQSGHIFMKKFRKIPPLSCLCRTYELRSTPLPVRARHTPEKVSFPKANGCIPIRRQPLGAAGGHSPLLRRTPCEEPFSWQGSCILGGQDFETLPNFPPGRGRTRRSVRMMARRRALWTISTTEGQCRDGLSARCSDLQAISTYSRSGLVTISTGAACKLLCACLGRPSRAQSAPLVAGTETDHNIVQGLAVRAVTRH